METIYTLRPDVVATVTDEGAVLLDLESKFFFSVNQTGWCITQLFESGSTKTEAVQQSIRWGAPAETDVETFITALQSERLIVPGEPLPTLDDLAAPSAWNAPTLEKHREPLQQIMTSAFDPTMPLAE